ncbi:MAG: hypothetical protein ACLQU1_35370 [Bryobacteraceae bacterium]
MLTLIPPAETAKKPQIDAAVEEVLKELSPAVQRIRYEIAQDWSGEWALFFSVLLSDEVSDRKNRREIVPRVIDSMSDRVYQAELGLFPHFHFRSQSEQAKHPDPAWE